MSTGYPALDAVFLLAGLALAAAFTTWAIVRLDEWARRQRQAPKFEAPRRMALMLEDTDDWDWALQALVEGEPEPTLREQEIQIPREGEPT